MEGIKMINEETIEMDFCFCPLTQNEIDKVIGKCHASYAQGKTIILRNFSGPIPRLIVDYGDILPNIAEALRILSEKLGELK